MANQTAWMSLVRKDHEKQCWLLDDGSIMEEPELEVTTGMRRVRLKALPKLADYFSNLDDFVAQAAQEAARLQGRKVWMGLGRPKTNSLDHNGGPTVDLGNFNTKVQPHFMDPAAGSYYHNKSTEVAWRFKHETLPIEAQVECKVEKRYHDTKWTVTTRLIMPSTSPMDSLIPTFLAHEQGSTYQTLVRNGSAYGTAKQRAREWAEAHPIDWCDGFSFGVEKFDNERQAVNHFARVIREINTLEEIDIPNLLGLEPDAADSSGITTLTLRFYRTNVTQDLLDQLSDYVSGQPVVERIAEKWLELAQLFRSVGMVLGDVKESDWWRFIVEGVDADPVEVEIGPAEDEEGLDLANHRGFKRHAVKINLATGSIVVACSVNATDSESAIQWETARIKAQLTGQEDELLAYARKYAEERNKTVATQMMETAVERAKTD